MSPPQFTGIVVKEYFPKCDGEFTNGFLGKTSGTTNTIEVRVRDKRNPWTAEVNPSQNYVVKYMRLDPKDISIRQKVVSVSAPPNQFTVYVIIHHRLLSLRR